ncbi:MAG: hypothetical protein CMQ20_05435 [Gammaproteobacteria bacterium]|jgi:uncharacterized protein|nr:hypothetical protein [Gammaproteobacteria bacterium]|tara:strand:- start:2049 stop:2570 length:522 start_codon:yes stop_codon:yes gene_type:complete
MLTGPLPERVNHRKLVSDRTILQGTIPLNRFSRLVQSLESDQGTVQTRLEFKKKQKQALVVGEASIEVSLVCQACLEIVKNRMEVGFQLILVNSQRALSELDQSQDGLVVEGELVGLVDLFEDELIISLPMVPRHNEGECESMVEVPGTPDADIRDTHRPFEALSKIQEDTDN